LKATKLYPIRKAKYERVFKCLRRHVCESNTIPRDVPRLKFFLKEAIWNGMARLHPPKPPGANGRTLQKPAGGDNPIAQRFSAIKWHLPDLPYWIYRQIPTTCCKSFAGSFRGD